MVLFLFRSKLEFLRVIIPRTRRLKTGSSNRKIHLSKWAVFPTLNSPARSPIQILTYPNTGLAELQVGGLKHNVHVCVHGEWRWQWRWQIQDNRARSCAEDTVQDGQRLMCVFCFHPLPHWFAPSSPRTAKLKGSVWSVEVPRWCHRENPEVRQNHQLGLGCERNGVWDGTGMGLRWNSNEVWGETRMGQR